MNKLATAVAISTVLSLALAASAIVPPTEAHAQQGKQKGKQAFQAKGKQAFQKKGKEQDHEQFQAQGRELFQAQGCKEAGAKGCQEEHPSNQGRGKGNKP